MRSIWEAIFYLKMPPSLSTLTENATYPAVVVERDSEPFGTAAWVKKAVFGGTAVGTFGVTLSTSVFVVESLIFFCVGMMTACTTRRVDLFGFLRRSRCLLLRLTTYAYVGDPNRNNAARTDAALGGTLSRFEITND